MIIRNSNRIDPEKAEFERLKAEIGRINSELSFLYYKRNKVFKEVFELQQFLMDSGLEVEQKRAKVAELSCKMHDIQAEWEIQLYEMQRKNGK